MAETKSKEIITPTTLKSDVWKHFGFYTTDNRKLDKTNIVCKICNAAVEYTGSTTNIIRHLKQRHGVDIAVTSASALGSPAPKLDSSEASGSGEQSVLTFFNAPLANSLSRSFKIQ